MQVSMNRKDDQLLAKTESNHDWPGLQNEVR